MLYAKSELQFQANDIEGVRKTADEMRKSGFRPGFVEWMDARILLAEEKWFEASKALYELQPKMADYGPAVTDQIAVQLGLAYEKSGRLDLAADTYDVVLQHNPANDPAKAGKQRVRAMKGQPAEDSATSDLDEQVAKILQQPKGRTRLEQDRPATEETGRGTEARRSRSRSVLGQADVVARRLCGGPQIPRRRSRQGSEESRNPADCRAVVAGRSQPRPGQSAAAAGSSAGKIRRFPRTAARSSRLLDRSERKKP